MGNKSNPATLALTAAKSDNQKPRRCDDKVKISNILRVKAVLNDKTGSIGAKTDERQGK